MEGGQDREQYDNEQPGDGEVGRIEALDERFGRIESEQAEHRALLEQIRDAIAGKGPVKDAHDKAQERTEGRLAHPPAQSVAEQVRAAVAAVGAEQAQAEAEKQHAADHDKLRELAERPPREAMGGFRGRLARAMYGGDQ
jgi:hypothetical protein